MNETTDNLIRVSKPMAVTAATNNGWSIRIPQNVAEDYGIEAGQAVNWYRDPETNDIILRFRDK